jgi:hypothetical protein
MRSGSVTSLRRAWSTFSKAIILLCNLNDGVISSGFACQRPHHPQVRVVSYTLKKTADNILDGLFSISFLIALQESQVSWSNQVSLHFFNGARTHFSPQSFILKI